MGTTTISLRDEAYQQLKEAKREDESFSDVVLRLTGSPSTPEEVWNAPTLDPDVAEEIEESHEEVGESLDMESGE